MNEVRTKRDAAMDDMRLLHEEEPMAEREAERKAKPEAENANKTEQSLQNEEAAPQKLTPARARLLNSERGVKAYQFFFVRLAVLLILLWVLFFKIIGVMAMPNGDMYPRVDLGDLVLFYRLDTDVRAQDLAVVQKTTPDTKETRLYVCRVVAVAGDTVEITEDGQLKINGSTMIESNIFYKTYRYEGYTEYPLTLGEDQCFVLVDKRDGGADSRYFGPVDKSEVLGTVITVARRNGL